MKRRNPLPLSPRIEPPRQKTKIGIDTEQCTLVLKMFMGDEEQTPERSMNIIKTALNNEPDLLRSVLDCGLITQDTTVYVRTEVKQEERYTLLHYLVNYAKEMSNPKFMAKHGILLSEDDTVKDILDVLIEDDWDIDIETDKGNTPLILAAAEPYTSGHKVVEYLLDYGADVNAVDANGRSALEWLLEMPKHSINGDWTRTFELLMQYDINVNLQNRFSRTPLLEVLFANDPTTIRGILYALNHKKFIKRVDLNAQSGAHNNTALIYAAIHIKDIDLKTRVIDTLLCKGANPFLKNNDGRKFVDFIESKELQRHYGALLKKYESRHLSKIILPHTDTWNRLTQEDIRRYQTMFKRQVDGGEDLCGELTQQNNALRINAIAEELHIPGHEQMQLGDKCRAILAEVRPYPPQLSSDMWDNIRTTAYLSEGDSQERTKNLAEMGLACPRLSDTIFKQL